MSSTSSPVSISLSTVSSTPQYQSKDFETAFGNLCSTYGLHGIPSPTVTLTPQELSATSLSASSKFAFVSHSSLSTLISEECSPVSTSNPPQSTVHIVPLGRHYSVSGDATVVPAAVQETKRDYEAAFGALSSTYGTEGRVPTLLSKHTESAHTWSKLGGLFRTRKTSAKPMQDAESTVTHRSVGPKSDYQSAYGNLSSAYGTSGNFPSSPSRRMKLSQLEGKTRKSLWSAKASSKPSEDENIHAGKDYNAAFGSLTSSYGFYGCPQVPSMTKKASQY